MTLDGLMAQIKTLSDAEKQTLIDETTRMLAPVNSGASPKVLVETALADTYTVDRPSVNSLGVNNIDWMTELDDEYLVTFRARLEARYAQLPVEPSQMLKPGILAGIIFDEQDFRLAEWHPTEEQLRGEP